MSMCPICNDTGWWKKRFDTWTMSIPCPLCTLGENREPEAEVDTGTTTSIDGIIDRCKRKPRTKTTVIPEAGLFCPDDDDNRLVDSCDIEIDDYLTNSVADDLPALMKEVERKLGCNGKS